jgi:transcription antitermination factor NusG
MTYWCVVRSEPSRENTAATFLGKAGYEVYLPRLRQWRARHGRRVATTPSLFPNYLFCQIERGWWSARWAPGVAAIIMSGDQPAKIGDVIITELRDREVNGCVELPAPPRLRVGDAVKIAQGAFAGLSGLVAGMRPRERVELLLAVLGRVTLPASDVEAF